MSQMNTLIDEGTSLDTLVGRRVHMIMWDQRITQTALGKLVGIDQSSLGKRLRGERGWSLDDLRAVAGALGTSMGYLLGENDEGPEGGAPRPSLLPGLDSNQEPAGFQPSNVVHVEFGSAA